MKNTTTGYFLSGEGQYSIRSVLPEFPLQFSAHPHPILIFVLIIELIAEKISVNLESVEKKLLKVESKTGYSHRFSSARIDSKKPRGTDYQVLAQSLGAQTCRFVLIKSLIVNATMLNNFIQEQLISTDYIPTLDTENFKNVAKLLLERTKITESTLKHLETDAGIEGRLQALQNVVS
jgi:hypothetical protein